jgi:hypothetical protein
MFCRPQLCRLTFCAFLYFDFPISCSSFHYVVAFTTSEVGEQCKSRFRTQSNTVMLCAPFWELYITNYHSSPNLEEVMFNPLYRNVTTENPVKCHRGTGRRTTASSLQREERRAALSSVCKEAATYELRMW